MTKKYTWEEDLATCGYDGKEDFLWFYVLGGCGCGHSDDAREIAWKVFEFFSSEKSERDIKVLNKIEFEMVAHWLISKDIIEHGCSLSGGWLTEEGKKLFRLLIEKEKIYNPFDV